MNEKIAETAKKALEILDRDGWNRGMLTWPEGWPAPEGQSYQVGSHCLGGAWNLALDGKVGWVWSSHEHYPAYEVIAKLIHEQYPEFQPTYTWSEDPEYFIATWNNLESTTEADVRGILEKLAAR